MLDQQHLKTLLHYEPASGIFTWLIKASANVFPGDIAGSVSQSRRRVAIKVDDRSYYGHRLAWLYMKGMWPSEIDHINGVLFIDHISKLKRNMVMKKFKKAAKKTEGVNPLAEDQEPSHHIG